MIQCHAQGRAVTVTANLEAERLADVLGQQHGVDPVAADQHGTRQQRPHGVLQHGVHGLRRQPRPQHLHGKIDAVGVRPVGPDGGDGGVQVGHPRAHLRLDRLGEHTAVVVNPFDGFQSDASVDGGAVDTLLRETAQRGLHGALVDSGHQRHLPVTEQRGKPRPRQPRLLPRPLDGGRPVHTEPGLPRIERDVDPTGSQLDGPHHERAEFAAKFGLRVPLVESADVHTGDRDAAGHVADTDHQVDHVHHGEQPGDGAEHHQGVADTASPADSGRSPTVGASPLRRGELVDEIDVGVGLGGGSFAVVRTTHGRLPDAAYR